MTTTLEKNLDIEIIRVTEIHQRWQEILKQYQPGMDFIMKTMKSEIEGAVTSRASGDVAAMVAAHELLASYARED